MFLAWFCFVLPRWFGGLDDVMDVSSRYLSLVIFCGRGRRPVRDVRIYIALIVVKEFSRSSLRYAEDNYSLFLFGERIDHSVIHYWEKRLRKIGIPEKILMLRMLWRYTLREEICRWLNQAQGGTGDTIGGFIGEYST